MDLNTVKSYLQNIRNNFTVFTLNVEYLNSTISEIQSLISDLSKDNILFDAICFQETWLHTNYDVGIFHLPAYNIIHNSRRCRIFLRRGPLSCEVPGRRDSVGGGSSRNFL